MYIAIWYLLCLCILDVSTMRLKKSHWVTFSGKFNCGICLFVASVKCIVCVAKAPVGVKMAQVFPKKYTQPKQVMQQADKHNYSTKQLLYDGASPHLQMSLFIFWTKMKHIAAAVAWYDFANFSGSVQLHTHLMHLNCLLNCNSPFLHLCSFNGVSNINSIYVATYVGDCGFIG